MSSPILQTKELSKNFGGLCAVDNVNFSIHPGEIIALIGPNGAGKTTFFNLLSGVLEPSGGSIHFKGRDITDLAPYTRCELGLSRTFQKNSLFPDLTVFENLRLGVEVGYGQKNAFWCKADSNKKVSSKVEELLAMMDFQGKALTLASNLSHGDQRLLEVLLGLATKPDLLMLDEPAAGLSPAETHRMIGQIKHLTEEAIGNVIIVEHDMEVVTELASGIYVLHQGQVLCTGNVDDIKCDPQVQEVYLGRAVDA